MKSRVGVIDVGSNSIKALLAEEATVPAHLRVIFEKTLEVRISQGIAGTPPLLQPERIEAGLRAVVQLWRDCLAEGPLQAFRIVATSAVRSSANGFRFIDGIATRTGIRPDILSGEEEAEAIAMGVLTDPGIRLGKAPFTVFDLGGGSLELIHFENLKVAARASLPLGAVRLTEAFIHDPALPLPSPEKKALETHVRSLIAGCGLALVPPLIGCGGGLAVVRSILSERTGTVIASESVALGRTEITDLEREVAAIPLEERLHLPGMPPGRADIAPAAFLVFRILLELAGADRLQHSFHNLRFGIAHQLLKGGHASS